MAGECDGGWTSWINTVSDGRIEVDEAANGAITGTHQNSTRPIIGQCTGGASPRITFSRTDAQGCTYIYGGEIIEVTPPPPGQKHLEIKPGTGKVVKICFPLPDALMRALPAGPPDDWVAVKDVT